MTSTCIFPESPFNKIEVFGISAINIVMIIVFTASLHRLTGIPNWILVVPVAFALFKAFCLDTLFFNKEKTGIVSGVLQKV